MKLSPYRLLIKKAAKARGVKFSNFDPFGKFQYLQKGKKKVLIDSSRPMETSHLAYRISDKKELTNFVLRRHKISVPAQIKCKEYKEAVSFLKKYKDIVVKPGDSSLGKGVTVHIKTIPQLKKAFIEAKKHSKAKVIVVEKFIFGDDYRISVINGKKVYALHRIPAYVDGDGKYTIEELINIKNAIKLTYKKDIKKDKTTKQVLRKQSMSLKTVPKEGQRVFLREIANVAVGGTSVDATDIMHPKVKKTAIKIAKVLKLPVAGIDLMTKDIKKPGGAVIEVNSRPHIIMHHYPHVGKPRDPAGDIIDMIFKD